MLLKDRRQAGIALSQKLQNYNNQPNAIILALPRGGVPVGFYIAKSLNLPLDIVVVRKISVPDNPELALGATTLDGQPVLDQELINSLQVDDAYLEQETKRQKQETLRRQKLYRGQKSPLDLENKIVILVDDGIATGSSMLAAVEFVQAYDPREIIIAVPVVAADTLEKLKPLVDEIVYLSAPAFFMSVGGFYENFGQTSDEEVVELLARSHDK